jgi:beta-lactamase superfamily II metal-dependent hydrolase
MKLKLLFVSILLVNYFTVKGYTDLKPILDAQIGQSVINNSVIRSHGTTYGVQNNVDLWLMNTGNIDSVSTISVTESMVKPFIGMFENPGKDTITVNGKNLGSPISISVSGNDAQLFSVSPSTITPMGGVVSNVPVIITYLPTAIGTHTAILHFNSANATEVTRTLNGSFNLSDQIGKPLQSWEKGQMDIYQINTGRGENYYLIYPDSTSMLIDAGDINVDQYANPQRPDSTRSAGEWVARFISGVNPKQSYIDYLLNSHFHSDHFGSYLVKNSVLSTDKGSLNYKPTGISRVGDFISIGKLVDRGYPDYNKPQDISNYQDIANYRKFVSWKVQTTSMQAEQFNIGSNSQFVLKHQPANYPTVKIQNLFANGKVWTGSGEHVIDYVAKNVNNLTQPNIDDNKLSCGLKVSYGNFNYFTGGDVLGSFLDENGVQINMESAIKNIVSEVDVCKANHHCFTGSMTTDFVNVVSPKIYFLLYINSKHLKTPVLSNLIANPKNGTSCLLAPTYLADAQRTSLMSETYYNQFTETGHIVVRVLNGGDKYLLYVLNDMDELKTVKAVYGPFTSKAPKNIYIDANHANANDANIGSDPNLPWKTLKTSSWNNLEDGSVINIAAGTYTWSTVSITKNLTVQGSSKDEVILQGMSDANFDSKTGNNDKLATIDATTVTFKKMTLRNSILKSGANGGFFYISKDKTLNLEDMILERSYGVARYGGAIASKGGLNCTDVTFNNNIAMQGGALFVELESGYYNFKDCKFLNNTTNEGSLGGTNYKIGGAIYVNNASGKFNNMNFDQCLFDSNESYDNSNGVGGALSMRVNVAGGQLNTTIRNSAFINNKTYGLGSAIYTTATGTATATSKFTLDIRNTSFIDNQNHQSGAKTGTTISIFTNTGYNTTEQKGVFNLANNTFYNNTNGNTGNRSLYIPDPKLDINIINNVFLDSPDGAAYSLFVQCPAGDIPVYSTLEGRGNIGDRMGGSLYTTNYSGYNWAQSGQRNVANVDNNDVQLNTIPQYNSFGIPYLAVSSTSSVLIDAGFSTYNVNSVNIVPQSDIDGKPIIGIKDVGVYEKDQSIMSINTTNIWNDAVGSCVLIYRNINNLISVEFKELWGEYAEVSVFNAVGQKVFNGHLTESKAVLNSKFQPGAYIVFVNYGSCRTSKKVMIY